MPDAHAGYTLPIGAVIKSKGKVFPSYVGYDIGCGMCAVKIDIDPSEVDLVRLKEEILKNIPIGFSTHKEALNPSLETKGCSKKLLDSLSTTGVFQLGTLGGGNHFIEVGKGESDGKLWIVIHSGSRGLGHKIAEHYMNEAYIINNPNEFEEEMIRADFFKRNKGFAENRPEEYKKAEDKYVEKQRALSAKKNKKIEGHFGIDIDSEIGRQYLRDMEYCLEYALENRKTMINSITNSIAEITNKSLDVSMFINRNHNHAELKDGYIIHRKGATHAEKGMMGVIPGNMRDGSFIVRGKGNPDSMSSSSHGAGRVLSRAQAIKQLDLAEFHNQMIGIVTNHNDSNIDEAPKAYKNIFEVMEAQKDLVEVVDRVIPLLNIKG
jgi:tRNA-splicing ligase RtcB